MREFDALQSYPATPKPVADRVKAGIAARIAAAPRGKDFFDGDRVNGYGGFKNDGRWARVAKYMVEQYGLPPGANVLQIQAEKGFLLSEFQKLGMSIHGTETSEYAIENAEVPLDHAKYSVFRQNSFDLVIAIGAVYTQTLTDAIAMLRSIEGAKRPGGHSFITLGAWESDEDFRLLRAWSLLGETLLKPDDWRSVMAHAGYTGDYKFVTAQSLGLAWS